MPGKEITIGKRPAARRSDGSILSNQRTKNFACTACGACCNRGPEVELGETIRLARVFTMSLLFKVHNLPIHHRSGWAREWLSRQESALPLKVALEERRRNLTQFASRRESQRSRERQRFVEISALVDDDGGGACPALLDKTCSIYADRPMTCRTVPAHYSRAVSTLPAYIDRFAAMPDHECDISIEAPELLAGNAITNVEIMEGRGRAVELARADRPWKNRILQLMDDATNAAEAGLPTYASVLDNADRGFATTVPMLTAWRIAKDNLLIEQAEFQEICLRQEDLIKSKMKISAAGSMDEELAELLAKVERERAAAANEQRSG